jgi:ABC-type nickel/cobalt efflux system permease component RcnA
VSYVDAGYSIALGVLFLYAVALVLRRRRWERALRVAEQTEHANTHTQTVPTNVEHTYPEHVEHVEHVEHAEHAAHAEEQTAPGARS